MTELHTVQCPYCGESFDATIDLSAGSQDYIEDCYVCCRPITFHLTVDDDGNLLSLETSNENE
jgi:hypothetical protein